MHTSCRSLAFSDKHATGPGSRGRRLTGAPPGLLSTRSFCSPCSSQEQGDLSRLPGHTGPRLTRTSARFNTLPSWSSSLWVLGQKPTFPFCTEHSKSGSLCCPLASTLANHRLSFHTPGPELPSITRTSDSAHWNERGSRDKVR